MLHLIGKLVRDAAVKEVNGKQVVTFTLAHNDSYKPKDGERVETTLYVNCSYWINANRANGLKKGNDVEVYGRPSLDAYLNRQGEPVPVFNVNVTDFTIHFNGGSNGKWQKSSEPVSEAEPVAASDGVDDLPF